MLCEGFREEALCSILRVEDALSTGSMRGDRDGEECDDEARDDGRAAVLPGIETMFRLARESWTGGAILSPQREDELCEEHEVESPRESSSGVSEEIKLMESKLEFCIGKEEMPTLDSVVAGILAAGIGRRAEDKSEGEKLKEERAEFDKSNCEENGDEFSVYCKGIVNQKREPWPITLDTPISPCIRDTSW